MRRPSCRARLGPIRYSYSRSVEPDVAAGEADLATGEAAPAVGAAKFLMVLWLALAYLEYRQATEPAHNNPADVIRAHRQEHAVRLLTDACSMVLQLGNVPAVLARFTLAPAPT